MTQKKLINFICITATLCLCLFVLPARTPGAVQRALLRTIVIDAGHGGKDSGAPGAYSFEKNIALAIALKLQAQIQEELPGIKVVMTRTADVYPTLYERANLANAVKGDLFISIHCNSADPIVHNDFAGYKTVVSYKGKGSKKKKYSQKVAQYRRFTTPSPAKGTETYIWAAHKNEDKVLAMRENTYLFLDSSKSKDIAGFDPNSTERMIYYSLKTQQYFTRSANLALTVEEELAKIGRISRDAHQRQAGIWVLQATAMPSVLVETGYISNPGEEDYLNSQHGQQAIAGAIVSALKKYQNSLERRAISTAAGNTGGRQ